jgi:ABC-type uncharacterized transport system substrate-binding protein
MAMKWREFIAGLGGAAAWPAVARAQQPERVRRIGVLMVGLTPDPELQARVTAFRQSLQQLGWNEGRNVRFDIHSYSGQAADTRKAAAELVALAPDVILTIGSHSVGPLLQATRTVPIVFVSVPDPVGGGFVDNLSRPGGNATGFSASDYAIGGKWLELLKEIAPSVKWAGVIRDPATTGGVGLLSAMQALARSLGLDVSPLNIRDASEIRDVIAAFSSPASGGLIVTGSALAFAHRDLIVALAAEHKLPAVYWDRTSVIGGGLISYGADIVDQYRRAASYVDRILKGEKPADLPVQAPTRYELVINLKTAKALGLEVPHSLLARADEVIE